MQAKVLISSTLCGEGHEKGMVVHEWKQVNVGHKYVHANADVCPCRGGVYVHMTNLVAE